MHQIASMGEYLSYFPRLILSYPRDHDLSSCLLTWHAIFHDHASSIVRIFDLQLQFRQLRGQIGEVLFVQSYLVGKMYPLVNVNI
jgi:hypothetical protein